MGSGGQLLIEKMMATGQDTFLERHFYIDDGLISFPSHDETIAVHKRAQETLAASNLTLHKFASNSINVMKAFPKEDLAKGLKDLDLGTDFPPMQRSQFHSVRFFSGSKVVPGYIRNESRRFYIYGPDFLLKPDKDGADAESSFDLVNPDSDPEVRSLVMSCATQVVESPLDPRRFES
ncbi:hypothetical protein L3Q82_006805 [Scortum barcoo]|uniref:Uncharacterized protein n=1 Tax=Scortum barcoo TaxID=214431 RepID=A0ACB8WV76_9TELE|nr:hypothetical protein L3Q82_006805 [Scortum barcoo]